MQQRDALKTWDGTTRVSLWFPDGLRSFSFIFETGGFRGLYEGNLVNSSKLADTFLSLSRRLVNASSAEGRKVKFLSAANLNGTMIDEKK